VPADVGLSSVTKINRVYDHFTQLDAHNYPALARAGTFGLPPSTVSFSTAFLINTYSEIPSALAHSGIKFLERVATRPLTRHATVRSRTERVSGVGRTGTVDD
jgi:hypothetical protein